MWIKGKGTCVWKPSVRFHASPAIRARTIDKNPLRILKYGTWSLSGVSEPWPAVPTHSLLRLFPLLSQGSRSLWCDLVWCSPVPVHVGQLLSSSSSRAQERLLLWKPLSKAMSHFIPDSQGRGRGCSAQVEEFQVLGSGAVGLLQTEVTDTCGSQQGGDTASLICPSWGWDRSWDWLSTGDPVTARDTEDLHTHCQVEMRKEGDSLLWFGV